MRPPRLILFFGLSAAATAFQNTGREQDVYRIYSQILNAYKSQPRFLIASVTREPFPWRSNCANVPPNRQAEFDEVIADLNARMKTSRRLERKFSLNVPYELLNSTEFLKRHGNEPRIEPANNYFTLAEVYFSRGGNLALTGISRICGGLCGSSSWKIFEKTASGEWQERHWITCFAVA